MRVSFLLSSYASILVTARRRGATHLFPRSTADRRVGREEGRVCSKCQVGRVELDESHVKLAGQRAPCSLTDDRQRVGNLCRHEIERPGATTALPESITSKGAPSRAIEASRNTQGYPRGVPRSLTKGSEYSRTAQLSTAEDVAAVRVGPNPGLLSVSHRAAFLFCEGCCVMCPPCIILRTAQ